MYQPLHQILVSWEGHWDSERVREKNLMITETLLLLVPMTSQEQGEQSGQRKRVREIRHDGRRFRRNREIGILICSGGGLGGIGERGVTATEDRS